MTLGNGACWHVVVDGGTSGCVVDLGATVCVSLPEEWDDPDDPEEQDDPDDPEEWDELLEEDSSPEEDE